VQEIQGNKTIIRGFIKCYRVLAICWFVNEGQSFCTTEGVKESTRSLYINSSMRVLVYTVHYTQSSGHIKQFRHIIISAQE